MGNTECTVERVDQQCTKPLADVQLGPAGWPPPQAHAVYVNADGGAALQQLGHGDPGTLWKLQQAPDLGSTGTTATGLTHDRGFEFGRADLATAAEGSPEVTPRSAPLQVESRSAAEPFALASEAAGSRGVGGGGGDGSSRRSGGERGGDAHHDHRDHHHHHHHHHRHGHRGSHEGAMDFRHQRSARHEVLAPPGPEEDEDCDMKIWEMLPDRHPAVEAEDLGGRRPPGPGRAAKKESNCAMAEDDMYEIDEDDPAMPAALNCYFDIDLGEAPSNLARSGQQESQRFQFASKAVYSGEWKDCQRHGVGLQIWQDGTTYIGQWKKGRACGKGRIRHKDGGIYIGEWVNGRAHGRGVYSTIEANYAGEFKCDLRDGYGVEEWVDKSWYAGQFRKGAKHGFGEHTWPDGTSYNGRWKANELEGAGCYNVAAGPVYKGQWQNSHIHGFGSYKWPDGHRFEGQYRNDKKDGYGVEHMADGKKREGFWRDGNPIGK
eukprot:TRINITY_DN101383_c0_g1_i1.p1 TRINITY_DN101383_c0_g1~~TRINITY_DN101383_c0_g1_i1.p1  ORF type:complete len:490 (+),score=114.48 TRINITY_DN101383_c0_g1_i1:110-1579(+)